MFKKGVRKMEEINQKAQQQGSYDPFQQKNLLKLEMDHLPFQDKCHQIAQGLEDAPRLKATLYTMCFK